MPARTAEVELHFLEKTSDGWEFSTKTNVRFDQLMLDLSKIGLFHVRTVFFTSSSGKATYEHGWNVPEESMWLLSHLFSNWTEMHEQATKRYAGQGKQEKKGSYWRCFQCDKQVGVGLDYAIDCKECHETFCMGCLNNHGCEQEKKRACADCGIDLTHLLREIPVQEKEYCQRCMLNHLKQQRQKDQKARKQESEKKCDGCGKVFKATSAYFTAHIDGKRYCASCYAKQQQKQQQQEEAFFNPYQQRHEWTFDEDYEEVKGSTTWENIFRTYADNLFSSTFSAGAGTAPKSETKYAPTATYAERAAFTQLGIAPTKDQAAIRKAFAARAKAMHPDTGGTGGDMDALTKAKETALGYAKRS